MKDWKTTLAGALKAIAALAGIIGINFSPEQQTAIISGAGAVYVLISAVQAYYTRDRIPKRTG